MEEKKKILIADDETAIRNMLVKRFTDEGFVVIEARDGEEALKVAFDEKPDVVVVDNIMPKLNGITVVKKLREDEWGKKVPVMMFTNFSTGLAVDQAVEYGVLDYFIKSDWNIEEIVSRAKERAGLK